LGLKKVLIISPFFPPSNTADMQRVRMSLPYFSDFGWEAEVVSVETEYAGVPTDELLLKSVPPGMKIHTVGALRKKWTSKLGLGSLGLRAFCSYHRRVSALLQTNHYDLIYFSTTQFPVCALGARWKKRFKVPYVIDMQDPWYTGSYYQDKPKNERPPKYKLMYAIHQFLERIAMHSVDGLISVSPRYIHDLTMRYPRIRQVPSAVVTFGASLPDRQIARDNQQKFKPLLDPSFINIVYIGRGGTDMYKSVSQLFKVLNDLQDTDIDKFRRIKFYFVGTSYAPAGQGKPTIMPLAESFGVSGCVVEITDRIPYYHALATLEQADALFIAGSTDPKYTASKIYPYLLADKPLLALFHPESPAIATLKEYGVVHVFDYESVKKKGYPGFY
jgi:hypothetical protein